ncbi:MAG: thioredoxin domain-containing protein, partial [Brachymonas sp.]|nr:thioredoxin domain-containing protein [Brachymonas sp.]
FSIRSIPTLILFKDGKPLATLSGARPKAQLAAFLDEHLAA